IKDWELDAFGKFVWVKLEIKRPQNRMWNVTVDTESRHFLIWHRDFWEEWTVESDEEGLKAKQVDGGPNPVGEVPLIIVRNERCIQHPFMGLSCVRDIADINIGILNWSSL